MELYEQSLTYIQNIKNQHKISITQITLTTLYHNYNKFERTHTLFDTIQKTTTQIKKHHILAHNYLYRTILYQYTKHLHKTKKFLNQSEHLFIEINKHLLLTHLTYKHGHLTLTHKKQIPNNKTSIKTLLTNLEIDPKNTVHTTTNNLFQTIAASDHKMELIFKKIKNTLPPTILKYNRSSMNSKN